MKKKVLKALSDAGFNLDLWYDRSAMQWVFTGPDTMEWDSTSTYIYRLNDLTPAQWVELANRMQSHNIE